MDGLVWWQGRVENINDPQKSGKVQVQIYNFYELPPKGKTQKECLPWCIPILPTTSPSLNGVGDTPQFVEGSRVLGFFIDGAHAGLVSKPYIIGTIPISPEDVNKNSIPSLAQGEDTVEPRKGRTIVKPPVYNAEYPYNRVIRSRKGHTIELDDTDTGERIRIRHGTNNAYIEIAPSGEITISTPNNITVEADGKASIHAKGDALIKSEGKMEINSDSDITLSALGNISLNSRQVLSLTGVMGIQLNSGAGVTAQCPAGVAITDGSLYCVGNITSGTGVTSTIIAGGTNFSMTNGILTGSA